MSVKLHGVQWGTEQQGGTRMVLAEAGWEELLQWNRAAEAAGERRRVFCASLADIFEDWRGPMLNHRREMGFVDGDRWRWHSCPPDVDYLARLGMRPLTMDDVRLRLFGYIDRCPWLDFLLLTKRPDRIRECWPPVTMDRDTVPGGYAHPAMDDIRSIDQSRPNVWLGASISDQPSTAKLPALLRCRDLAPVLFASAEPLVGPVRLGEWLGSALQDSVGVENGGWPVPGLDWLIVGGESGPRARRCDVGWIRALLRECRTYGVPAFVKQLGSRAGDADVEHFWPVGTQWMGVDDYAILRHKKGGDPAEWPDDLRVRELPKRCAAKAIG